MKLASIAKKSKYGEKEMNNSISLKYGPDLRSFKLLRQRCEFSNTYS